MLVEVKQALATLPDELTGRHQRPRVTVAAEIATEFRRYSCNPISQLRNVWGRHARR